MKTIRVKVLGRAKTGKSRLIAFIAKALDNLQEGDEYADLKEKDILFKEILESKDGHIEIPTVVKQIGQSSPAEGV